MLDKSLDLRIMHRTMVYFYPLLEINIMCFYVFINDLTNKDSKAGNYIKKKKVYITGERGCRSNVLNIFFEGLLQPRDNLISYRNLIIINK